MHTCCTLGALVAVVLVACLWLTVARLALTDRLLTPKCSFATLQVTMVREGFPEFLNFNCSFLELNRFICNKQSVLTVHCKLHVS